MLWFFWNTIALAHIHFVWRFLFATIANKHLSMVFAFPICIYILIMYDRVPYPYWQIHFSRYSCTAVLSIMFWSENNEWLLMWRSVKRTSLLIPSAPLEGLAWFRTRSIVQCVFTYLAVGRITNLNITLLCHHVPIHLVLFGVSGGCTCTLY